MHVDTAQTLISGAMTALVGWRLYVVLTSGKMPVTWGGASASRKDDPFLYWLFTLFFVFIWLVIFRSFVASFGLIIPIPWFT